MPARLYRVSVTPRFELFYALFALTSRQNILVRWKRAASDKLGHDFTKLADHVAPSAYMWPLLADALRTQPLDIGRDQIVGAFNAMDDRTFQRDVLGGLFKREGIPEALIEGGLTLRQAVVGETTGARMLEVIGLRPFHATNSIAVAIQRVITDPRGYRGDVAQAIEKFWDRIFDEVWQSLAQSFKQRAARITSAIEEHSLGWFLRETGFPLTIDERRRLVTGVNNPLRLSFATLDAIEIFPSAFNFVRFWATYERRGGKKALYFPVLHPEPIPLPSSEGRRKAARGAPKRDTPRDIPQITTDEAKAAFIALGDKTRFAMAVMLARSPQTSVELARTFGVSKPTISHHVQLLRAGGLLRETPGKDGVTLSIDRAKLESLSSSAAKTMFEGTEEPTVQRTRSK